jgi:two-component system response regulator HydG
LGKSERGLSPDAQDALRTYRWPGNTRELENAIERALILAEGNLLTAAHLGLGGAGERRPSGQASENAIEPAPLAEMERRAILAALEQTHGNKTRAAALLGITRTQLHTRLKRFGIA